MFIHTSTKPVKVLGMLPTMEDRMIVGMWQSPGLFDRSAER
jgi:hypothetical protein